MRPILVICASDTLVNLLVPVASKLEKRGLKIKYATLMYTREKAEFSLAKLIDSKDYVGVVRPSVKWLTQYSSIVIGNDWGDEIKSIIYFSYLAGIPSICLQESVIDFSGPKRRLQHASHVLLQGVQSSDILVRKNNTFITGNPRYDSIKLSTVSKKSGRVFVNVNFTYGIEEHNRSKWIADVIIACKNSCNSPILVQHPRDKSDLSVYDVDNIPSNAAVVHDLIIKSDLVITRFSSLIHEALCVGRPVIYYNPTNENICYKFDPDGVVLGYAENLNDLKKLINKFEVSPPSNEHFEKYLQRHLSYIGCAADYCAKTIFDIVNSAYSEKRSFARLRAYLFNIKSISKDVYRLIAGC